MHLPPLVEPAEALTQPERRRYARHLLLPQVGLEGQLRLKNAKVLCVGAGGLGSPALLYLAAAGVGTLGIVDFDVVEESNLQRQVIHGADDVGRLKTESARDAIHRINPAVDVVVHDVRLDSTNALEVVAGYDVVLDGTDNFPTRYLVNDACVLTGTPYVWGSIFRFDGQAAIFWAEHGPCYRCLYPEPPAPGTVPGCAEGGVLGVLCASIGSIQVTEVVKLITGAGEPLVGRLMVYDALEMSYRALAVHKDPACALCGTTPTITTLVDYDAFCGVPSPSGAAAERSGGPHGDTVTATELRDLLHTDPRLLLVDVREPHESAIVAIPSAVLVPLAGILDGSALPALPRDRPIVLHCRSGVRSARALAVMREAGFGDVRHLAGGVLAWVDDVDPSLARY